MSLRLCERGKQNPMSEVAGSARAAAKVASQTQPSVVNEGEVLNWNYALEEVPVRPSGTVEVVLRRVQQFAPVVETE